MRMLFSTKLSSLPIAIICFLLSTSTLVAAEYYVSPSGSDSNPGTLSQPFRTIRSNLWRLQTGDTVILRGGIYEGDRIYFDNDPADGKVQTGTATSPITFKAYPGEKPILNNSYTTATGGGAAIVIGNNNKHIVFDGINIHNVYGHFVYMDRGQYITIKNCEFKNADGNWMGVYLNYSSYVKIQNCIMDEVSDNTKNENVNMIHVEGSHHNLFENLTITRATHSLIDFQNSYSNIVRNNILHNEWQKNSGMAAPYSNDVGRNLYENNRMYGARPAYTRPGKGAMGLYVNQSNNIIRRNVFYDNQNFGILTDANNAFGNSNVNYNKVYNNTFYNNGYLQGYSQSANFTITDFSNNWNMGNNTFKNNISMDGQSQNIYVQSNISAGLAGNVFAGNCLYNPNAPSAMFDVAGIGQNTLSWFQSNHSSLVYSNTETNPGFVSATNADFSLSTSSGCIDKGTSLTTTRSSGSGTLVPVYDVGYFTDGMGLISGDTIRVGSQEARITAIDYANNNLTVDRSISWSASAPVNLPFAGNAPDPGAYESGFAASPLPSVAPTATPTPSPTPIPIDNEGYSKLIPTAITASSSDGTNVPANTTDGDLSTRWSACGVGEWLMYDFGSTKTISHVNMSFYRAATQVALFDIEISNDGVTWTKVFSGQSGTETDGLQKFNFTNTTGRYVRIIGNGNLTSTDSCWNSYTEVETYGATTNATPPPSTTAQPTSTPLSGATTTSYYGTFDSETAITTPLVGTGGRLSGATLTTGKLGNGISAVAAGQHVAIPSSGNFNKAKGTVEFWFKPNWSHTDGLAHPIFSDASGAIHLIKEANNSLRFYVAQGTTYPDVKVSSANYSFASGSWYKIRLQWDDQAAKTEQLKLFINGTEPSHTDGVDDLDSTKYNFGTEMVIGSAGSNNTNAVIDELRVSLGPVNWKIGDSNEDGFVDGKDYVRWINNYGKLVSTRHYGGDYNLDGVVDGKDYVSWINNYGK